MYTTLKVETYLGCFIVFNNPQTLKNRFCEVAAEIVTFVNVPTVL